MSCRNLFIALKLTIKGYQYPRLLCFPYSPVVKKRLVYLHRFLQFIFNTGIKAVKWQTVHFWALAVFILQGLILSQKNAGKKPSDQMDKSFVSLLRPIFFPLMPCYLKKQDGLLNSDFIIW